MNSSTSDQPDPVWLVTGASSGIGAAVARALAGAGAGVVAWGRDPGRLAALWADAPRLLEVQSVDLDCRADWTHALQALCRRHPGLRGVVHCAGVQEDRLLTDRAYDPAAIDKELRLNLTLPAQLLQALAPQLATQPWAGVVLTSSALAFAPKRRAAVYSASKAGVHALCEAVRAQWAADPRLCHVQLMELIPPLVNTPMTAGRGRRKLSPEAVAARLLPQLLRKTWPPRLWVGQARVLPWLLRLAPGWTRQLMLR